MSGSEGDVETEGSDNDGGRQLRHKNTSPGGKWLCLGICCVI